MKKYHVPNYIRYKEDLKATMPEQNDYSKLSRNEMIVKFMPLVENLARKFSTTQQASGVLSINDLLQIGNEGLIRAVDKLDWEMLDQSEDIEKTLKSFLSKRIKGNIRRRIDMQRGDIRIPEHKLNEIRKNPQDKKMVAMFFNSVFLSIDAQVLNDDDENMMHQVEDKSEPYNIQFMNVYLKSLMQKYLTGNEYEVLRLSYGLDCDKHSAKEIASILNIEGVSSYVRVSELKKQAVQKLENAPQYDLVLMDVQMPVMDGYEATRQLRERGFTDVPIIGLSANAMKEDRQSAMDAGMNDYLTKPIKQKSLIGMLRRYLVKTER